MNYEMHSMYILLLCKQNEDTAHDITRGWMDSTYKNLWSEPQKELSQKQSKN